MITVAIDPGPAMSGVVAGAENMGLVTIAAHIPNAELPVILAIADRVIVEWTVFYGRPTGESVFRTAFVCGRISQLCNSKRIPYHEMSRPNVCQILVGRTRGVTKSVVRAAVIDKYPATGGGATPQIGTKKEPGPLYIFRSTKGAGHAWDALALYHAWKSREVGQ